MKLSSTMIGSLLMSLAFYVAAHAAHAADAPDAHKHAPLERIAGELHLTAAQRSQVDLLWQANQPTIEAFMREFARENNELENATPQGLMDETKLTEIANREGATLARLLVVEQRLKAQIYSTVLTPEQRAKANKLSKQNRAELAWIN